MKVIPKRDLLWLIQTSKSADSVFLIEDVEELFETYGDDYYINQENGTYELCNQNEARKKRCPDEEYYRRCGK